MPCLWYMTHHVPQRFIQWIKLEKKKKTWLPSDPWIAHNSLLCVSVCVCVFTVADIVAVSIMASPGKCYLTSAGLCIVLSGACHLTCHPAQVILNSNPGGWARKYQILPYQMLSFSISLSLSLSLRSDDLSSFNINLIKKRLYCHLFSQLWDIKWLARFNSSC